MARAAGWRVGGLAGLAGLAGWLGWLGWLGGWLGWLGWAGWLAGWLAGLDVCWLDVWKLETLFLGSHTLDASKGSMDFHMHLHTPSITQRNVNNHKTINEQIGGLDSCNLKLR